MIARPGAAVKGRIVTAGIPIGVVARAAGFSACSLSEYLTGKRRNVHGQHKIAAAFRRLSGQYIPTPEFWGDLWAEAEMKSNGQLTVDSGQRMSRAKVG